MKVYESCNENMVGMPCLDAGSIVVGVFFC
jgi:hypothetical protein